MMIRKIFFIIIIVITRENSSCFVISFSLIPSFILFIDLNLVNLHRKIGIRTKCYIQINIVKKKRNQRRLVESTINEINLDLLTLCVFFVIFFLLFFFIQCKLQQFCCYSLDTGKCFDSTRWEASERGRDTDYPLHSKPFSPSHTQVDTIHKHARANKGPVQCLQCVNRDRNVCVCVCVH